MTKQEFLDKLTDLANEFEKNQEFINRLGLYVQLDLDEGEEIYEWNGNEFKKKHPSLTLEFTGRN